MMTRSQLVGAVLMAALPTLAAAQERRTDDGRRGGAGDRAPYVTSTGQTVPRPGSSQGAGTTPLDKGIQNEDNKIDGSICKGC